MNGDLHRSTPHGGEADRERDAGDDSYREWDAAYVLGSLSSAERHEYERHLGHCAECRRAVTEIASLPGLLGAVPRETAEALRAVRPEDARDGGPSTLVTTKGHPDLVDLPHLDGDRDRFRATGEDRAGRTDIAVLARRTRARRRRRRWMLSAAALALVGATAVGTYAVAGSGSPGVVAEARGPVAFTPVNDSGLAATVAIADTDWGARVEWSCSYPPERRSEEIVYELVVIDTAGEPTVLGTWRGTASGAAEHLVSATQLSSASIDRIEIRVAGGGALLASATL